MNHGIRAGTALLVVLTLGCGDDDSLESLDTASSQALETADFCSYGTFDFFDFDEIPESEGFPPPPLAVAEAEVILQNEITGELTGMGLELDAALPDLRINSYYQISEILIEEQDCGGGVAVGSSFGYSFGYVCDWPTEESYPLGTVITDLVDRSENTLVYRGVMQGVITGNDREGRIDALVTEMLADLGLRIAACP